MGNFGLRLASEPGSPFEEQAKKAEEGMGNVIRGKVGLVFTFATLLCMANMFLVSKVQDMRDVLGDANKKFLGARLVLLIAQIQPQVLSAITQGVGLHKTVQHVLPVIAKKFPK